MSQKVMVSMSSDSHATSVILGLLLAATCALGGLSFHDVLASDGLSSTEAMLLALYTLLIAWIGASFWICALGAYRLLVPRDDGAAAAFDENRADSENLSQPPTAVVMPIYHEDAQRVFHGLRATYESLSRLGALEGFHFFVLSDSRDPAACRAEEAEWLHLVRALDAGGRIFYRRRRDNAGKKAGNIREFCERWGRSYRYMLILDADSVMNGRTIRDLVGRMEAEPRLGLLQAWPAPIEGVTFFARAQQFAAALHGRLMAEGLRWLMGPRATYWGHNALVRVSAFMQSCGLPELPGRPPLGGEILSHDFVEAALLLRNRWRVRITTDLGGSYEEGPPSLVDHAKRDRRWCQGNLQHARLLLAEGFPTICRLHFLMGIFAYLVSPIWMAFILLGVLVAGQRLNHQPSQPLPELSTPLSSLSSFEVPWLVVLTATLLLGPKILGVLATLFRGPARRSFGGARQLIAGGVAEVVFSALIAPAMLLLHSAFVAAILSGRTVRWNPQRRDSVAVSLADAGRAVGLPCALASAVLVGACAWSPSLVFWLLPLLAGFLLAVPLIAWSSTSASGAWAWRRGLLRTPSEVAPDHVIRRLRQLRHSAGHASRAPASDPLLEEVRRIAGSTG